jgi:uncharacterized Zn finger protein (UPF0148 family)
MNEYRSPKAGEDCPECHYHPLYEDIGGDIVCVGCDRRYAAEPGADLKEEDEDDAY